ncbi:hypothetical protein [Amycolatopsis sp. NPDC049868]|uniref:hypothetical protein n=1 Tax=Amycolatopsis sp. NPDC049868 TaxID=3363934 RepID=UPI0037B78828
MTRTSPIGSLEYLVLGDSFLILDPGENETVVTDDRIRGEALATYSEVRAAVGGSAAHQEAVRRHRAALQARRNVSGGYWVASDLPEAADHALTGTVAIPESDVVLLATDGMARLTFFDLAGWSDIAADMQRGDLSGMIARLRETETGDAAGERWPRAKCHDDATAVLVRSA